MTAFVVYKYTNIFRNGPNHSYSHATRPVSIASTRLPSEKQKAPVVPSEPFATSPSVGSNLMMLHSPIESTAAIFTILREVYFNFSFASKSF